MKRTKIKWLHSFWHCNTKHLCPPPNKEPQYHTQLYTLFLKTQSVCSPNLYTTLRNLDTRKHILLSKTKTPMQLFLSSTEAHSCISMENNSETGIATYSLEATRYWATGQRTSSGSPSLVQTHRSWELIFSWSLGYTAVCVSFVCRTETSSFRRTTDYCNIKKKDKNICIAMYGMSDSISWKTYVKPLFHWTVQKYKFYKIKNFNSLVGWLLSSDHSQEESKSYGCRSPITLW